MMKRILVTVAAVSLLVFPSLANADGFSGSDGSFENFTHSGHGQGYGGYRGYGGYGYYHGRHGRHGRADVGSAVAVGVGLAIVGTIINQAASGGSYGSYGTYGPYDTYESDYYYDDRGAYYAPVGSNDCNGRRDVTSTATYGSASCGRY